MTPTRDQIMSTVRDALEQTGSHEAAIAALANEIETLPLKPVLRERYALARLELLRMQREEAIAAGNTALALRVATLIDRSRGLY